MKIAIYDDCMEDALTLKAFLGGHEARVYSDADSILTDMELKEMRYDLYLLDIYMEGSLGGIEIAGRIRDMDEEAVICFVSSSNEFYREAYELYALQYLVKPVKEEAVRRLLDRVSRNLAGKKEKSLVFKSRGQAGSIPYGKIRYISSREHTICIYCTDGTVQEYRGKLNELALQICGDVFFRCHQSFLVNLYHVDSLNGKDLVISGERIPVSRKYYAEVKRRYQDILFEEVY